MTREEAKDLLPIIQAFAEGKTIEFRNSDGEWDEADSPTWGKRFIYRIKPEPKYRPFKTTEECWQEMLKHQPFGWIKPKESKDEIVHIGRMLEVPNNFLVTLSIDEGCNITSSYLFSAYTFIDGTPLGIKEE